jgi:hypothetical protein
MEEEKRKVGRPRNVVPDEEVNIAKDTIERPILSGDTWAYHETIEPHLFRQGEIIPDGWGEDDMVGWRMTIEGIWERKA